MAEAVCNRCNTIVDFQHVTAGYWAYCPHHEEDLFKFECRLVVWDD